MRTGALSLKPLFANNATVVVFCRLVFLGLLKKQKCSNLGLLFGLLEYIPNEAIKEIFEQLSLLQLCFVFFAHGEFVIFYTEEQALVSGSYL